MSASTLLKYVVRVCDGESRQHQHQQGPIALDGPSEGIRPDEEFPVQGNGDEPGFCIVQRLVAGQTYIFWLRAVVRGDPRVRRRRRPRVSMVLRAQWISRRGCICPRTK